MKAHNLHPDAAATAQPKPRKGGPRDIPAHIGLNGRTTKAPQPEATGHEDQRVKAIKAHIQKGQQYAGKSEQHFISAGLLLDALKREGAHKAAGLTWEMYAKDVCGISRSRADELIMIADGRATLEETRAGKRGRVEKSRAQKPPLRSGGSSVEAKEEPAPQTPAAELITAEKATVQAVQPAQPVEDAPGPALPTRKQDEGIEIPSDFNLTPLVNMRVERTENLVQRAQAAGVCPEATDADWRPVRKHHRAELANCVRQRLVKWDRALDDMERGILDAEVQPGGVGG